MMLIAGARRAQFFPLAVLLVLVSSCSAARELSQVEPISLNAGVIGGVVTDSLTQQPITGASLTLLTATGDSIRDQQSTTFSFTPGGTYRFDSVRPGTYLLRAKAAGYDSVTVTIGRLDAGERHTALFRLRRR